MSLRHTVERLKKFCTSRYFRFTVYSYLGWHDHISDEDYLKKRYELFTGEKLDLAAPTTLNEKLQWLKLYDRNPEYTKMADKYEVKKIVAEKIGKEHIIPLLGVWDDVDEIDFGSLPDRFVLKCTHDSGGVVVCRDKKHFNIYAAKKKLNSHLKRNFFRVAREWAYKDIKPRIIAEEYIDSLGKKDSLEYKVTCFNGKVGFITVCRGKAHDALDQRTNDSYDTEFCHMPWYAYYKNSKHPIEKPKEWKELIEIAEKLGRDIPYVRVDCYIVDGKVYFGELTFYTWAGFIKFDPPEWDKKLGDMLRLPIENK